LFLQSQRQRDIGEQRIHSEAERGQYQCVMLSEKDRATSDRFESVA
jgi:hypothetical protein